MARQRQRAHAPAVHAVLQPGHARERGQVGQRGRHDAHRGDALDAARPGLQLRADQRLPVQLPRPGVGQPAADVDGGAAGRGAADRDQEVVRGRRDALPEHQVAPGRQRAAARSARLHALGQPGRQLQRQRQLRASARRRQRHRRHGLGLDPQRLPAGQAVLPQHEADAQRLQHHQLRHARRPSTCRSSTSSSARTCSTPSASRATRSRPPATWRCTRRNLDRLAATGLPIQITELDIDGSPPAASPGDEVQLRDYRKIVPVFWEHPGVEGITVWGWRQPNHWRNAQNAPIVLSNDTPKPAALWLYNYVRGIAPVDHGRRRASRSPTATPPRRHGRRPTTGPRQINRPNLRTFTWRITGGSRRAFSIDPSTGELRIADQRLRRREHDLHAEGPRQRRLPRERRDRRRRSSPGPRERRRRRRRRHRARDALARARRHAPASARSPRASRKDYEASTAANVISTAGDATLSVADPATASPGKLVNGAFSLAQPVQAAVVGRVRPGQRLRR